MKRKIIVGFLTSSLLLTPLVQATTVFAQDMGETTETTMTDNQESLETTESTIENSEIFSDPIVPVLDEASSEGLEVDMSEEATEESSSISSEVIDSTTTSSETIASESSAEEIQYEDVFYNGQWFRFPVQKETTEPEVVIEVDHKMGDSLTEEAPVAAPMMMRARVAVAPATIREPDKITEKQKGRPRWDFIDVSSHNGTLSVKDYEHMKANGVTGVVVKLTEYTTYQNPFAKDQIANAIKAGLKVSTYHYSHFTTRGGAEAEATYYAAMAKSLGLPSSTVMVNDIEETNKFNASSTQNSIYFANKLKSLGYPTTIHYSYEKAFANGSLNASILGAKNIWKAQYPYTPSDKNILHTNHAAWQWSASMEFSGIKGKIFDVNVDHTGLFSNRVVTEEKPKPAPAPETKPVQKPTAERVVNQYATINSNGYSVWSDFSFSQQSGTSANYFQQTFYVDKEYTFADGLKYVSLKNNKNQILGYLDSRAVTYASNQGGAPISDLLYVTVRSKAYAIWEDLTFSKQVGMTSAYYHQTLKVKEKYNHHNGSVYYVLYTKDDKRIGYLNATGVRAGSGSQGIHFKYGKFVTLKGNYDLWGNFGWTVTKKGAPYKNQTFEARGYYNHLNGSRYLSLYTNTGKWLGYINERGVYTGATRGGSAQAAKFYKKIVRRNYAIWNDFGFSRKRGNSSQYLNQTLYVGYQYRHFNGATYYSLYNSRNQWLGYINATATR